MPKDTATHFVNAIRDWAEAFMQRSMHGFVSYAKEQNLSLHQFGALFHVQRTGGCAVTDIGNDLGITTAAVSQMLDRLLHQGLIAQTEDPNDRRVKRIELTEYGAKTVQASLEARQRWFGELADTMTRAEQDLAITALKTLTTRVREMETTNEKTG